VLTQACARREPPTLAQISGDQLTPERSDQIHNLYETVMAVRGVRAMMVLADGSYRVMVDDTFQPPTDGWGEELKIDIVNSCVPSRLLEAATRVVSAAARPRADLTSVGYDHLIDAVMVVTAMDGDTTRRMIEDAYGQPFDPTLIVIVPPISASPAVGSP
jgi:hypothetical protein